MSRFLAPSTPAHVNLGDTIHPIEKGGFGSNTHEGIRDNIGAFTKELSAVNLDENGKVILTGVITPGHALTNSEPILDGPKYFNFVEPTIIKITNYNSLINYSVTTADAEISFKAGVITIPSGIEKNTISISINGRSITLDIIPSGMSTPSVNGGGLTVDNKIRLVLHTSPFLTTQNNTHKATEWQISTDPEFLNIVSTFNVVDDKTVLDKLVDSADILYARARFIDNNNRRTDWSASLYLDKMAMSGGINIPVITADLSISDVGNNIETEASAFFSFSSSEHTASEYILSEDFEGKTILDQRTLTDVRFNPIFRNVKDLNEYYVKVRYYAKDGAISDWSAPYKILKKDAWITPTIKESSLMPHADSSGYLAGANGVGISGNRKYIILSNEGASGSALTVYKRTLNGIVPISIYKTPYKGSYYGYTIRGNADGSRFIVGNYSNSFLANGYLEVFSFSEATGLVKIQTINTPVTAAGVHRFGYRFDVTSDGEILVVGDVDLNEAYYYKFESGSYVYKSKITPTNVNGITSVNFGVAVNITEDKNVVVIGDWKANVNSVTEVGAIFIFKRNGDTWTQIQALTNPDKLASGHYAHRVGMDRESSKLGVTVTLVSTSGGYIYARNADDTYSLEAKIPSLYGSDLTSNFSKISITNNGTRLTAAHSSVNTTRGKAMTVSVHEFIGGVWKYITSNVIGATTITGGFGNIEHIDNGNVIIIPDAGSGKSPHVLLTKSKYKFSKVEFLIKPSTFNSNPSYTIGFTEPSAINTFVIGDRIAPNGGAMAHYSGNGRPFTQVSVLNRNAVNMQYGHGQAISGDGLTAVAGDPVNNSSGGTVFIYKTPLGEGPYQIQQIDSAIQNDQWLGCNLSINYNGSVIVSGAYGTNNSQGAAWIIRRSGGLYTSYSKFQRFTLPGAVNNDMFGIVSGVSDDGNVVYMGGINEGYNRSNGIIVEFNGTTYVTTYASSKFLKDDNYKNSYVKLAPDGKQALSLISPLATPSERYISTITKTDGTWVSKITKIPSDIGTLSFNAYSYSVDSKFIYIVSLDSGTGMIRLNKFDAYTHEFISVDALVPNYSGYKSHQYNNLRMFKNGAGFMLSSLDEEVYYAITSK